MATYHVNSGAAGANSGADWTNAFTSFASAITAATVDDDIIKVHYTHQDQPGSDQTYSFTASIIVVSVNKDNSDAPTVMGTNGWLGNNGTSWSVIFQGSAGKNLYTNGLTIRLTGSNSKSVYLCGTTDGADYTHENLYVWGTNTAAGSTYRAGSGASNANVHCHLKNFTFQTGHVSQSLTVGGALIWEGGSVSSSGSSPTNLILPTTSGTWHSIVGVDLSHCGSNAMVASNTFQSGTTRFVQCKLGTSYAVLATQAVTSRASHEAWLLDCHSGDTHGVFGHYNALGSTISDTSIYVTSSPSSGMSWKIVGTSAANRYNPYYSPWIRTYNADLATAISPRIEILRDGSATAYTDAEVWGEFSAKNTSGSTQASFFSDRATVLAAGADQSAGTGVANWTGDTGAWSGKVDVGAAVSFTPDEVGDIRGRVVVGGAFTVYAEPVIRGIAVLP